MLDVVDVVGVVGVVVSSMRIVFMMGTIECVLWVYRCGNVLDM